MVALLSSLLCIGWNFRHVDRIRFLRRTRLSVRETRTTGPGCWAKRKTELGDGKHLRRMGVNRTGLFGRITRLDSANTGALAGPPEEIWRQGLRSAQGRPSADWRIGLFSKNQRQAQDSL
jgi:hypothetical protein